MARAEKCYSMAVELPPRCKADIKRQIVFARISKKTKYNTFHNYTELKDVF